MRYLVLIALTLSMAAQSADDVASRAMRDELQRSMKKLQLESLQKPYFIAYRISDAYTQSFSAALGSLLNSSDGRGRTLSVSVRVGSYDLDNSNFLSFPFGNTGVATRMFADTVQLPLDDNYDEIRRQIWIATDGAYKKALEDWSGKRAALENKNRPENTPDFTKGAPIKLSDNSPPVRFHQLETEKLVRRLSAIFRDLPAIQNSSVHLSVQNVIEHLINSEGADISRTDSVITFRASAETQADDGTPMSDSYRVYCHSLKDLPAEAEMAREIHAMADRLIKRETATKLEQYNGPVLFEGQAAAELFARNFALHLPAQPAVQSDNPQFVQAIRAQNQSSLLLNKIGARVMPEFISVLDSPGAAGEGSQSLMGGYKVDEEGTPSQETLVVQNGILKTLLTSRVPVRGVLKSTGNSRGGGVAPSNLMVNSSKSVPLESLNKQLLEMVKSRGLDYGIIVRHFSNNALVMAWRVYADGHEELIRKGSVSGFSISTFKELAAVSNHKTVYTEPFTPRSASPFGFSPRQGSTLVTYVVPDMLFEDISLQPASDATPKLPLVPRPPLQAER